MATLTVQQAKANGTVLTFVAATAGPGDSFRVNDDTYVVVKNADASAKTVTIVRAGLDEYGLNIPDITLSVPAGGEAVFGPIPPGFADQTDGLCDVTFSAVTSVTVAVFRG